jgi:hypothetical protein
VYSTIGVRLPKPFSVAVNGFLLVLGDEHRDHAVLLVEHHPAHAVRDAAHRSDIVFVEAHCLAGGREQHHVVRAVGERRADQRIAVGEIDGDDAGGPRPREIGQRRLLTVPIAVAMNTNSFSVNSLTAGSR